MRANKIKETPSIIDLAKKRLYYTKDGFLIRKTPSNDYLIGPRAGTLRRDGYRRIGIAGIKVLEHRLIYAMHHGEWPSDYIDHINGNREDNRIENLRDVTHSENIRSFNRPRCFATSHFRGVNWHAKQEKWMARITLDSITMFLGLFQCEESAAVAYNTAAIKNGFNIEALNKTKTL